MLTPGTAVGPYKILTPLGAGGMGEVYRARDTRLGRDVALKIIAAALAYDRVSTKRFEQESRAAGALNHPNVCAVFDIGECDGSPFVVMELLEGSSLRARLKQGPIPVRKAIDWTAQAAHGLAAAHEKGIVHRDLKPENLFLTKDGRIKVLDFGLAKLMRPELLATAGMDAITVAATQAGAVIGTAGYMAPEQLRGEATDQRADLFALGAVLYELLAGKQAFAGDTFYESAYRIVHADPEPLGVSGRELPAGLEAIVRRCLEKRPEERFQSAKDLAFDLEGILGTSLQAPYRAVAGRSRQHLVRRWLPGGLLVAVLLAVGFGIGQRQSAHPRPTFHKLSFGKGVVMSARFTPDGNSVVYSARYEGREEMLFGARVDAPEATPIEPRQARVVGIRGSQAAVILPAQGGLADGTLATIPVGGGTPRPLLQNVKSADVGPDGKSLAVVVRAAGNERLEYPPGTRLFETAGYIGPPRISPRGDRVAFTHWLNGASITVVDVSGRATVLSAGWHDAGNVAWAPDGSEVWFAAGEVWGWNSLRAVTMEREVRTVLEGFTTLYLQDIDRDGRVLVTSGTATTEIWGRAPRDAGERSWSWLDGSIADGVSADGASLLFTECSIGGGHGTSMYMRRLDGSLPMRLAPRLAATGLSSDGAWAIGKRDSTLVLVPTGAGESRALSAGSIAAVQGAGIFPDGKRLLITGNEADRPLRLFVQDLAGGPARPVSPEGVLVRSYYTISPDGTQIAVIADGAPALVPVAGGEPRRIEGLIPGDTPIAWTRDGSALFVVESRSDTMVRIILFDVASRERRLWRELRLNDPAGAQFIYQPVIARDGDVYFYSLNRLLNNLFLVEGLR